MATTKKRINITLSPQVETLIMKIAKRDAVPAATKVSELLETALHLEEDLVLGAMARVRDTKNVKFVSHAKAWK